MLSDYKKPDDSVLSVTKQLVKKTFSAPGTDMSVPDLVLHLDRGYWCWDLIIFLLSSCCQIWGTIKRMPWFPFTYDQFMKPYDKRISIEKEGPPSYRVMQTKIGASTSSTVSSHSYRDRNGNITLLIDSATKNILNFDYVCKYDHELNDYISNALLSRSWYKIVESRNESKEIIKSAMDNLIRTKIIPATISVNTPE